MFCTSKQWATRGDVSEDWNPAGLAGGMGWPAVRLRCCFGLGVPFRLMGTSRLEAREIEGGYEFVLHPKARLQLARQAELPLPAGGTVRPEFGAFRPLLILDAPPLTPSWEFQVTIPGNAKLCYQPPLTAEQVEAGAYRPPHMVGAYVLFWRGLRVGAFYRPSAVDADGHWTYGSLSWEAQHRILTKGFPADWLATATYPVLADAALGDDGIGGSTSNHGDDFCIVCGPYQPASGGSATRAHGYLKSRSGSDGQVTLGFYNESGGEPNALQADTDGGCTQSTTAGWHSDDLDSATAITVQNYYPGANCSENVTHYYDSDSTDLYYDSDTYSDGTLPSPYDPTLDSEGRSYSFYIEYTPAAGNPWYAWAQQ